MDDHWIVMNHRYFNSFYEIFVDPFIILFSDEKHGRFRPLYDVLIRFFSQFYGLNPFLWYLSSLIVAIVTTVVFYLVGKLQKFSNIESACFAALIVFGPQASTYARFGTPETTSTFLIALALFFASINTENKKIQSVSNILFVFFTLLAALNKEACILMIPALCLFRIWNSSQKNFLSMRESFERNRIVLLFLSSVFVICIICIKINNISGPGYASIDQNTFSIFHLFKSLEGNLIIFRLAILVNLIFAIIYLSKKYSSIENITIFYALVSLMIIPQLIIYNKVGMADHYYFPASIGISLLISYPILKIREQSIFRTKNLISKALLIVVVACIYFQINLTEKYFKHTAVRVSSIQSMVESMSSCVDVNNSLIVLGNPYINYEMIEAFKIISSEILKNDQTYLVTYGSKKSQLSIDTLKDGEKKWAYLNPENLENRYNHQTLNSLIPEEKLKIKGIVLANAGGIEKKLIELKLSWFKPDTMNKKYYPEIDVSVYCKK
jgi:hypothetical protein